MKLKLWFLNSLCDFLSFEPQHDIVSMNFKFDPPEGGHVWTFGGGVSSQVLKLHAMD